MASDNADGTSINHTAQGLLRLIIGSYFLAVALQLIPGTDLGILFSGVMPAPYDSALAMGLVFALAFMVMLGHATRLAALVMALITFYASYLTMLSLGVADELGAFWRDLALIAALLLTYSDGASGERFLSDAEKAIRGAKLRPAPAVNFATLSLSSEPISPVGAPVEAARKTVDPNDPNTRLRAIFRDNQTNDASGIGRSAHLSNQSRFRIWGA